MASNPKDPMSRFFEPDIVRGNRSYFNWSYKNRVSADYGYVIPVGLWDLPADTHFELDVFAALSSFPTIAPLLGKLKFRLEAYFVEKACYNQKLRNNDRLSLDRDIPWPVVSGPGGNYFSPRGSLTELLQIYPAGFDGRMFVSSGVEGAHPPLNAIPLIMYYDIYRNYYVNPQDPNIPFRKSSYVPGEKNPFYDPEDQGSSEYIVDPIPITDYYITRDDLDEFVDNCRSTSVSVNVDSVYRTSFGVSLMPSYGNSTSTLPPTELDHLRHRHYGLLRRTYNNDFFTSYVSNDNVELMKSHANIQVNNNLVNVEQISLANRNWRIATRSILWGTDWKDYNKVHYGVNLLIPYGKPQFLGALSSDVTFNDVISQAQTGSQESSPNSNVNLGSRAGLAYGVLKNHKGKFVEFNTKDEGYVMVVASLVPEVDYYQGIDPMYFKTNLRHSWLQELNSVGMQDFHKSWATCVREADTLPVPFDDFNQAIHKVPIWFEYMAKYNQLHGDFTGENQLRYWVYARPFDSLAKLFPGVFNDIDSQVTYNSNLSTYVLPELFNYVFANNLGQDNFQLQFNFDCKASTMLDKQVIAYL